jgi:RNA polymerase sigma-70 factor (ECF subfamily)
MDVYRPYLESWIKRDPDLRNDVEDLVQETLAAVVQDLPDFHRERTGSFRCWLRTIVVHRIQNLRRHRRRHGGTLTVTLLGQLADPNSELSQHWDREHDAHVVNRLLDFISPNFTPQTWRAFRLVTLEGRKPADVAQELGLSVNAVLLAKSRILQRLREEGAGLLD